MDASFAHDPRALPPLTGWRKWAWLVNIGVGLKPVPGLIESQAETTVRERFLVMRMACKGYVPDDLRLARFAEAAGRNAERLKRRRTTSPMIAKRLDALEVAGHAAAERVGRHPGGAVPVTVAPSLERLGIALAVIIFTVSITAAMALITRTEAGTVFGFVGGIVGVPAYRAIFRRATVSGKPPGYGLR